MSKEAGQEEARIQICFDGLNERMFLQIKPGLRMKKAMALFAKKVNMNVNALTFMFEDGVVVRQTDTAKTLGLVDSDVIMVSRKPDGGCSLRNVCHAPLM